MPKSSHRGCVCEGGKHTFKVNVIMDVIVYNCTRQIEIYSIENYVHNMMRCKTKRVCATAATATAVIKWYMHLVE